MSLHYAHSLARTLSASSVSSEATNTSLEDISPESSTSSPVGVLDARRTRKRFTSAQLVMLEQLFHQCSHPTREQREALAKEAGIELRSVTVWFQNKRQTERKVALTNATNSLAIPGMPFSASTSTRHAAPVIRKRRTSSSSLSSLLSSPTVASSAISSSSRRAGQSHAHRSQHPHQRRPSLDHVATRHERPHALQRTPTRPRTFSYPCRSPSTLWENMPSSPLGPSPERTRDRAWVDFGRERSTRTLEWACAAASLAGKTGARKALSVREEDLMPEEMVLDLGDETENEAEPHEAITPNSSLGAGDQAWRAEMPQKYQNRKASPGGGAPHDDDMMNAALALCGLGRR